jgi:hypothetical protein
MAEIFLPLLTHSSTSCPIFHLDSVHVLKNLKIQLPLDLNGEGLEAILCLRCECSSSSQYRMMEENGGTHLSQRVINSGLLCDIENLGGFHICYHRPAPVLWLTDKRKRVNHMIIQTWVVPSSVRLRHGCRLLEQS